MKDDPELELDDESTADRIYSPKGSKTESDNNRLLFALIAVLLILFFAGSVYHFITRRPAVSDATLQSKITSLEEKITGLQKQMADFQGKSVTGSPDSFLLHRVDTLAQKLEELERKGQFTTESKAKPSPLKVTVTDQKQYHTVQKGETLSKIGKKYKITVEELRKLNGLSRNQHVRTGQKLLITAGR